MKPIMKLKYSKQACLGSFVIFLIPLQHLFAHELEGEWIQPCSNYFRRIESIIENQITLTETSYSDSQCTQDQISIISSGSIALGIPLTQPEGSAQIDFTFSQVEIELKTSNAVSYFKSKSMCEISDWKLNTRETITGLKCDFFNSGHPIQIPSFGEKRFGIYKLEQSNENAEKKLYFGQLTQNEDARTEAKRPTTLDPYFYTKAD